MKPLFRLAIAGTLWVLGAFPAGAADLVPVPQLTGRVIDQVGVLSAPQRDELEADLAAVESQLGAQIVVLVIPTTHPEAIEQYSLRVTEAWKLGREKEDDGLLFLVAVDDHGARFETGYGLEGVLPDAMANRILDELVIPHFKQGDFNAGIRAGVQSVVSLINGANLPAPAPASQPRHRGAPLQLLLVLAFAAVFILPAVLGRLFGGISGGIVVGVLSWLLLGSLFIGIVFGALALVFGLIGLGGALGAGMGAGGWSSRRNGFGGGGFGGFGGGGFGGGGGSFGGGGASGNW